MKCNNLNNQLDSSLNSTDFRNLKAQGMKTKSNRKMKTFVKVAKVR